MSENPPDEQLMLEYQLGSEAAFAALYARHSVKVYGYLCAKTRNDALARDIFQAAFLKLHLNRDRYQAQLPFLPWLFTICRNELIDTMRKRAKNLEDSSDWLPDVPSKFVEEEEKGIDLRALPASQKVALEMRYRDDLPFEQIARRLETTPANARKLVSRGIKSLRRIYGKK